MSIDEFLLSAALQTGLDLVSQSGFENETHALRERLRPSSQREHQTAFQRAYQQAADAYRRVAKPQEADLKNQLGSDYETAWEQLRAEIRAGRSLVLLDGLDEVPEAGPVCCKQLKNFSMACPKNSGWC